MFGMGVKPRSGVGLPPGPVAVLHKPRRGLISSFSQGGLEPQAIALGKRRGQVMRLVIRPLRGVPILSSR